MYIEKEQFGVLYNYKTGDKVYLNIDMLEIIKHLLNENSLDSFFPDYLSKDVLSDLLNKSHAVLQNLMAYGFLTNTTNKVNSTNIRHVLTNPSLWVVFLETTKKCNLKCRHCYLGDNYIDNQLTYEEIRSLIMEANDLGVMEIQLTGGEIFVLPFAFKLVKMLRELLMPCSIFTNGYYIPAEIINFFKNDPTGYIFYISLDGPENIHDYVRGKGSFKRTFKNIKLLQSLGCDIRINTAIGDHNIDYMKDFIDFISQELQVFHRFVSIENIGRARDNSKMLLKKEKFAELFKSDKDNLQFLDSHDPGERSWQTPACGVGHAMLFVDAFGNISLCPTLTRRESSNFQAGNIRENSIKDIWETSDTFKTFRNIQCEKIEDCVQKVLCSGGCRSKAYLDTGNINGVDIEMCSVYL